MSDMAGLAQYLKDMSEVARDIADRARGTDRFQYLDGPAEGLNAAYLETVIHWLNRKQRMD